MSSPLILVVDDEPLLVMALEDHLVDAGFAVVTACSVEQAMRRLDEHSRSIHALVTDVRMPGGQNGWDLARMARERDPSLVVMYLTCDSVDEWPSRGVPSSQVLGKPYASAHLTKALSVALSSVAHAKNTANAADPNPGERSAIGSP